MAKALDDIFFEWRARDEGYAKKSNELVHKLAETYILDILENKKPDDHLSESSIASKLKDCDKRFRKEDAEAAITQLLETEKIEKYHICRYYPNWEPAIKILKTKKDYRDFEDIGLWIECYKLKEE